MQTSDTFSKTPRGQSEIDHRTGALSMKERRVLILVNGHNDAATLAQLSLCDNIEDILHNLLRLEFIQPVAHAVNPAGTGGGASMDSQPADAEADEADPREFMCNTLLTFGNRVRVAALVEQIYATDDLAALQGLVKSWYAAISETPGGMYQADDLRKDLQKMLGT
ncbi:MAG: hypothetical protein QNJ85_02275 [Gammaproteobacteria bacterium]|nr:hypothetical protein [Gammaproteobacteria bacterium]